MKGQGFQTLLIMGLSLFACPLNIHCMLHVDKVGKINPDCVYCIQCSTVTGNVFATVLDFFFFFFF